MTTNLRPRLLMAAAICGLAAGGTAQALPSFEVYGFAMADFIQDFNRVDPAWDDTLRPSKIPTIPGQFGSDGQSLISAKQSRFGIKAEQPIAGNDLKIKFEFDLYGVGVDAGQTTMRLRHFYGEWGPVLAGQTNTVFMDIDTFPNVVDYWGPNGMVFLRNPQVRFTYKHGGHEFAIAVEKPSNDIDPGDIRLIAPELGNNLKGDEKIPDFTAHWRYDDSWGHVQIAGILRQVSFETIGTVNNQPKNSKLGWGVNGSVNFNLFKKDILHLSAVYGDGIASYMNDGGVDLAPGGQPVGPTPHDTNQGAPRAEAVPLLGLVAYYDHAWSDKWSSSAGWSMTKVWNRGLQSADAFQEAQYASGNVMFSPDKHILMGPEFLWGQRKDKDGATGHDTRIQFSFKYSFTSKDYFH